MFEILLGLLGLDSISAILSGEAERDDRAGIEDYDIDKVITRAGEIADDTGSFFDNVFESPAAPGGIVEVESSAGNDGFFGNQNNDFDRFTANGSGVDVAVGIGKSTSLIANEGDGAVLVGVNDIYGFLSAGSDVVLTAPTTDTEVIVNLGDGDDVAVGGFGNDELRGNEGDDLLSGRRGDDRLFGEDGDDHIWGGGGADLVFGVRGDDFIDGGRGDDALWGQGGDDEIRGRFGDDRIRAGQGADIVRAGFGDDDVAGGNDDDMLWGAQGDDTLAGDGGDDMLYGGWGDDTLTGGVGSDFLDGGGGQDDLQILGGDTVFGGSGVDSFVVEFSAEGAAADAPVIKDFTRETESLVIVATGGDDVEIQSLGSDDFRVVVDGILAVTVENVPGFTADDVTLVVA